MKRITVKFLQQKGACISQCKVFKETFPRGAAVTKPNALLAARKGLSLEWLISSMSRDAYRKLPWNEMHATAEAKAVLKAEREFHKVSYDIERDYGKKRTAVTRAYDRALKKLKREVLDITPRNYEKMRKQLSVDYNKTLNRMYREEDRACTKARKPVRVKLNKARKAAQIRKVDFLFPVLRDLVNPPEVAQS